jgi:hypothetical protein
MKQEQFLCIQKLSFESGPIFTPEGSIDRN